MPGIASKEDSVAVDALSQIGRTREIGDPPVNHLDRRDEFEAAFFSVADPLDTLQVGSKQRFEEPARGGF